MNREFDVIINGCGPIGAMMSILLARGGLNVLIIERDLKVFNKPRAIVLDSEAMRVLQFCGVANKLGDSIKPHPGTDYLGLEGQLIKVFDPQPPPFQLGWPATLTFVQPVLEKALRKKISKEKNITLLLGNELIKVSGTNSPIEAEVLDIVENKKKVYFSKYLIGCDGGNSFVRKEVGVELEDLGVDEDWLVVDAYLTGKADLPPKFVQYCWPSRPATFVIGPKNIRRWEIKILPGEDVNQFDKRTKVTKILKQFVDVNALKIWRTATYKHRVTSSKRWRVNNIFIAGDAAHRTPPFLGQGLCTGIRDVANLSWKILHKEKYGLSDNILKTYESERKPHAKVVIKHAKEFGKIIGELNPKRAEKRDRTLRLELLSGKMVTTRQKFIPDISGNFLVKHNMKTKECRHGGTLFVQPKIKIQNGKERLLEDFMPMSFLYLTNGQAAQVWMNEHEDFWNSIDGVRFSISSKITDQKMASKQIPNFEEIGTIFKDWYSRASCEGVVVRPDRYVFSTIHGKNDLDLAINKLKKLIF